MQKQTFGDKAVVLQTAQPLGRPQPLYANFFKVVNDPSLEISKFYITCAPELPSIGTYNGIKRKLLDVVRQKITQLPTYLFHQAS